MVLAEDRTISQCRTAAVCSKGTTEVLQSTALQSLQHCSMVINSRLCDAAPRSTTQNVLETLPSRTKWVFLHNMYSSKISKPRMAQVANQYDLQSGVWSQM